MCRSFSALTAALCLVFALAAPVAAEEDTLVLAGTNVLTATTTSRIAVHLDRAAVLDLTPETKPGGTLPRALAIAGGGSGFAGFAISDGLSTDGFFAIALRTPELGKDGKGHVGYGQTPVEQTSEGDLGLPRERATCVRCELAPGDYFLYLVTAGRSTITLTLEGVDGQLEKATNGGALFTNGGFGDDEYWFEGGGSAVTGGSMGQWFWASSSSPKPGILVAAYRVTAAPSSAAPVVAVVDHCASAGGQSECDTQPEAVSTINHDGYSVTPGVMDSQGVDASISLTAAGAARYTVGQAMLWLPLDHFIPAIGGGPSGEPDPPGDMRVVIHRL